MRFETIEISTHCLIRISGRETDERILAVLAALVLLTGLAATIMMLVHTGHTSFGGIHGKIGFLMLAIAIGHTFKRAMFLKK